MPTRRALLKSAATAVLALSLAAPSVARSDGPMPVVATFSILGDMVKRIGDEHVAVTTLVGPDGDTHVYQPTPADARAVSEAAILVVNGLQFEGWLDRLIDASDFRGVRVVATEGAELIAFDDEHDGEHDTPAAATKPTPKRPGTTIITTMARSMPRPVTMTTTMTRRMPRATITTTITMAPSTRTAGRASAMPWPMSTTSLPLWRRPIPANAADFYQNRAAYVAEIEALDAEIREIVAALPADRRIVVTSHDAFQYFGRDYGLTFLAPQGLSTESEASAKDVARLIERIRDEGISAVFVENITDPRLLEQIANETGATIGGTLYPGALSGPDGPAPTYLDMMRHNATRRRWLRKARRSMRKAGCRTSRNERDRSAHRA